MSVVCDVVCCAVGDQYLGSPLSGGSVQGSYGISFTWDDGGNSGDSRLGFINTNLLLCENVLIFSSKLVISE